MRKGAVAIPFTTCIQSAYEPLVMLSLHTHTRPLNRSDDISGAKRGGKREMLYFPKQSAEGAEMVSLLWWASAVLVRCPPLLVLHVWPVLGLVV